MSELLSRIEAYLEEHREEFLADIIELCRINSERMEPEENAPYGRGPREALDCMLAIAQKHGFAVRDYDGYVGTADLSDQEKKLDILAHLDVVPVQDDWTVCDPFEPTMVGDRLYGRGTSDDKGPAIAALYAMKAVRDLGLPLNYSARLIFGTDEECGSSDLDHYYAIEKEAPMSFSPDAEFPIINIEKGHCVGRFEKQFEESEALPKIVSIDAGTKFNVVPGKAAAVVAGLSAEELADYAKKAGEMTGAEYRFSEEADGVHILCVGAGAHAAMPADGNNALTALLTFLTILPIAPCDSFTSLQKLVKLLPHGDFLGKNIGVQMADDLSGELTLSFTMFHQDAVSASGAYDSRVPICGNEANVRDVAAANLEEAGYLFHRDPMTPPHHVDEDSDFIRSLLASYETVTGQKGSCMAIGGGTYVHRLANGVAFGCASLDLDNHMHGADEFVVVQMLIDSAKIFALAIADLCR